MKTIKLLTMAAVAAMAMMACSKSEPAENSGAEKRVTVKVVSQGLSRAVDKTSVTYGYQTPINDVTLYFLDGNDKVVSAVGHLTGAEITSGKTFTNINASAVKVYIVANTQHDGSPLFPGLASIALNQSKADIEAMAAVISTQMDNSAMGVGNVVLSGENTLTPIGATDYTSNVMLTPAVCRFEVTSISAQTGPNSVTAFNLEGIYMNTYYTNFTIGGRSAGTYYGLSTTMADLANVAPYMKDTGLGKTGGLTYRSSAGKVWAYMVPVGNTPPMIVFRLDNVEVNNLPTVPSTKYVTVKNFRDSNTGELISPERGEVYVIKDVLFTANDITDDPNDLNINVTVTVDVMGWKVYSVDPLL